MKTVAVKGSVRVEMESPFIATVPILMDNDVVMAALIGNLGRVVYSTLRMDDILQIEGHWKNSGVFDCGEIYVIESMLLPQDAATGRNLNAWA